MKRIAVYHLETLLWIARLGTFAAAAERLNTTQPAISARIRELEAQLGMAIFRRDGRRMTLTVRGRQLVRDCEPLWGQLEAALQPDRGDGPVGVVRIGAGEIAAASCLPGFVAETERRLPGISFDIEIDLTAQLQHKLLGGETDIVFLAGPLLNPAMRLASIGSVRLLWLGSADTASRIAAAGGPDAGTPIWSLPHHSPIHRILRDALRSAPIPHRSVSTCSNMRMLIDVVTRGAGIGLFPETMVRAELAAGSLVEILPPPATAILFQAAIREDERDPIVLDIFDRASALTIEGMPPSA